MTIVTRKLGGSPIYNEVLDTSKNSFTQVWQDWFNEVQQSMQDQQVKSNASEVLNPDFNLSRINGTTPINSDGELVDKWFIRSNGNTFTATPVLYTETFPSAQTGSAYYININITAGANDFEIYQQYTNGISRYEDKDISFVSFIRNNNHPNRLYIKSYIGFDTNNDGSDEYSKESGKLNITSDEQRINSSYRTPDIDDDNQNNKINFKFIIDGSSERPLDIDIFYIKFEIAPRFTGLYVNHTLDKLNIDNL